MKKKKIIFGTVVTLLSALVFASCSNNSATTIATIKGAKITADDYYEETKMSQKQAITQMIVYRVFTEKYGDKVSKDVIKKEVDKYTEEELTAGGFTTETFSQKVKEGKAFEEGMKAHMDIKADDLKKAFETFHPEVEAQIIQAATEDDAKAILKEINDGGDFTKIAKEKSTNEKTKADGGTVKFSSSAVISPDGAVIPQEVKTAAFALKDKAVSDVITSSTLDQTTYQTVNSFYIVKMVKNVDKGTDYKKYKKELTTIVENNLMYDSAFQTKVIAEELKAANAKVTDTDLKGLLDGFTQTTSTSSTGAATSNSSSKAVDSSSK